MLWWYLGVPKEPGLIFIVYISYDIFIVHGPNICVVLWLLHICRIYGLPILTWSIEEINSFLVKGLLHADNTQWSRARQRNRISIGLDENSLEQRSLPSYCRVPRTRKKEKVDGNSERNRGRKLSKRFLVWKVPTASETSSCQKCLQLSISCSPQDSKHWASYPWGPQFCSTLRINRKQANPSFKQTGRFLDLSSMGF